VLLAHIVASRTNDEVVTDEAMDYPRDWNDSQPAASTVGHQEDGRTICIHSLGVLPQYQGRGLGHTLLLAYIQQMQSAGIADRLAIIAHNVSYTIYQQNLFYCADKTI
jgi:ribosomal protein S18 acetylase RimI-like enzyme